MKRASAILESTRLDRQLNFEEISKRTRIPVRYLIAFENEDISQFPSEPYCSLMLKDYADFLGLNGSNIICLFRRDFDQKKKNKNNTRNFFSFTPQFTFKISIITILILFSSYLVFEYIKFNQPPKLKINWPLDTVITNSTVSLTGTTDIEATIRINDDLIIVDNQGNFNKKIDLGEGENKITVESKSPSGKVTYEEKIIKYSP